MMVMIRIIKAVASPIRIWGNKLFFGLSGMLIVPLVEVVFSSVVVFRSVSEMERGQSSNSLLPLTRRPEIVCSVPGVKLLARRLVPALRRTRISPLPSSR